MFNIYVERVIEKDIEEVFNLLADHEGYSRFKVDFKLLETGVAERNVLGALRYVDLGGVKFEERITCFERPYRLDYKIEKSSPLPFKHELGSINLKQVDGGTKVTWISRGTIAIPLLGKYFLDKTFEKKGEEGFGYMLKQMAGFTNPLKKEGTA